MSGNTNPEILKKIEDAINKESDPGRKKQLLMRYQQMLGELQKEGSITPRDAKKRVGKIRKQKQNRERRKKSAKSHRKSHYPSRNSTLSARILGFVFFTLIIAGIVMLVVSTRQSRNLGGQAINPALCRLVSANFSKDVLIEGERVNITVTAENCEGGVVIVEVREFDAFLGYDNVKQNPPPATITNGRAITTWTAEYQPDFELLGSIIPTPPPEYYAYAYIEGYPEINITHPFTYEGTVPVYQKGNISITFLRARDITDRSATIEVSTDIDSYLTVKYGKAGLGNTAERGIAFDYHKVTLRNLEPGTTYSFKVYVRDLSGTKTAESETRQFTTLPSDEGVIIIDNLDAGFSKEGGWKNSSFVSSSFGEDSLYSKVNKGNKAHWNFTITKEGVYKVEAWWASLNNYQGRASDAKYVIKSSDGETTVAVDQRINEGKWNKLGEFNFSQGKYSVTLLDTSSSTSPATTVSADAVRISYLRPLGGTLPSCQDQNGQVCQPGTECPSQYIPANDTQQCCPEACTPTSQTCQELGGEICDYSSFCPSPYLSASDTQRCCAESCIPVQQSEAATISIQPSEKTERYNSTVSFAVVGIGLKNVNEFRFSLNYDPSIIEYVKGNYTGFFKLNPGDEETCLPPFMSSSGFISPLKCRGKQGNINKTGAMVIIDFRTKEIGNTTLWLTEVVVKDASGREIPVNVTNATLVVAEPGCEDFDDDGFISRSEACLIGTDCDDTDPFVNPGASEICNGIDDNCDGLIDNDVVPEYCENQKGACYGSVKRCVNGTFEPCGPADYGSLYSPVEVCDGYDNNCDGEPDNNLTAPLCEKQLGVCANATKTCLGQLGWLNCTSEQYGPYYEPLEESSCDGLDNDCDGQADEMTAYDVNNCGACGAKCELSHATAACSEGDCEIFECEEFYYDFNGKSQDGCEKLCIPGIGTPENTSAEYINELLDSIGNETLNTTELCDGLDNDCDGTIDEGCLCQDGETRECGSNSIGECKLGTQTCVNGNWGACEGVVGPEDEVCDGLDNDCDGTIDEGLSPPLCGKQEGVCLGATKRCGGSSGWLPCTPAQYGPDFVAEETELHCDGLDNDCDGQADEMCSTEENASTGGEEQQDTVTENPQGTSQDSYEDYYYDETPPDSSGSSSAIIWVLLLIILVLVLGGGYAAYVFMKRPAQPREEALAGMASRPRIEDLERLKKYSLEALELGYTPEEITRILLGAGWRSDLVSEAMASAEKLMRYIKKDEKKDSGPRISPAEKEKKRELIKKIESSITQPESRKRVEGISKAFREVGKLEKTESIFEELRKLAGKKEAPKKKRK